jgi:hypothetical protein
MRFMHPLIHLLLQIIFNMFSAPYTCEPRLRRGVAMRILTVVFLLALATPTLGSGFYSAGKVHSDWIEFKKGQNGLDHIESAWGNYLGYVMGVVDSMDSCLPEVKAGQLTLIVGKYLEAHPEKHHQSGNQVVMQAISQAFPCNP